MDNHDRNKRDLIWCLGSQALVAPLDAGIVSDIPDGIEVPAPPDPHRFRLGQHFERLLAAFIDASPAYELIAANLQVRSGTGSAKRTLGEFDFLVATDDHVEHWEAAIKFYLGTGNRLSLSDWYGPNTEDRFDVKYERLMTHQLTLSDNAVARALLDQQGIQVSRRRCFMKGRLFHPFLHFDDLPRACPPAVNPQHEAGWWISYMDFTAAFPDLGHRFVYLPKSLWLSPLLPEDYEDALSYWEVCEFLSAPSVEQATHLALVGENGEISRGFVVNDQWLTRINAANAPGDSN